jgi:hypothetical protein
MERVAPIISFRPHSFVVKPLDHKISGPNLAIHLQQTPLFEWCMVRCKSKNGHQNDIYLIEIGNNVLNIRHISMFKTQDNEEGICDFI